MNAPFGRPLPRILLSTLATVTGVLLLLSLKPHTTAAPAAVPPPPGATSGAAPAPSAGGTAGSRTVEGDAVQTQYGPVQLRVTLSAGRITAVSAVKVPDSSPRDQEIADFAVPRLTKEALAAQSARIDTVSGATYTSEGYIRSLQSALDQAHG